MNNYFTSFALGVSILFLSLGKVTHLVDVNGSFIFCASISAFVYVLADLIQFFAEEEATGEKREKYIKYSGVSIMLAVIFLNAFPSTTIIKNHTATLAPLGDTFALGGLAFTIIFSAIKDLYRNWKRESKTVKEREFYKQKAIQYREELARISKLHNIHTLLDDEVAATKVETTEE